MELDISYSCVYSSKNQLIVIDEEQDYTWDDAVHWGLLSPTLYSWNEDSYESLLELSPWSAFWVHASRDLTVEVRLISH